MVPLRPTGGTAQAVMILTSFLPQLSSISFVLRCKTAILSSSKGDNDSKAGSSPVRGSNFVEQGRVTVATASGKEPLNHDE